MVPLRRETTVRLVVADKSALAGSTVGSRRRASLPIQISGPLPKAA